MIRKKVIELVDDGVQKFSGYFKDGVSRACDEVCGRRGEEKLRRYMAVE